MTTAVFPLLPSYSMTHEMKYTNFVAEMGDGFEQRINKNLSFGPRGDGLGTAMGTSYKGINTFGISFRKLQHINADANALANKLWIFYVARLGNYEPFYFYNPSEQAIDISGTIVTGRYLVRFVDPSLTRELFIYCLYKAELKLVEVRA